MNLNTNGAKTIAALVVLNVGLFVSQHATLARVQVFHLRAHEVGLHAPQADICAARAEAHAAAIQARLQAQMAQKAAEQARKQMEQNLHHVALMAPSSTGLQSYDSLTKCVRSLVTSTGQSINGGI